ncbi:MAG: stage III sporulation protein AE [Clostridia bacterium]|nr:stage III sporulation protein AE [Clostridia bacterium]
MMIKKIYALVVAILLAILPLTLSTGVNVYADNGSGQTASEEFDETINEQLENLDLSGLNNFFENYCDDKLGFFEGGSILDKISAIINGDFGADSQTVLSGIANIFLEEIVSFLPLVSSIIAIAVLASLITELKSTNKSVGDIVHFVCFGVIIVLIMSAVTKMIALASSALTLLDTQMEIMFPILLTLLTAIGGTVSVAVYQPAVAVLTSIVTKIFAGVLLPLFVFAVVLTIISHISPNIKLDKIASFLFTLFKWIIGIVFTVFMAFLAIKGITAGSIDSVSFKTARYSLSTYVPIVGGYLSEGLNLILASCVLIKNAVGTAGLFIMFSTILLPLVQLVLFMFVLKFTGAVLGPLSDSRVSNFLGGLSKVFLMPIVMILAVAFMYVVFVGLIMCTSVGV